MLVPPPLPAGSDVSQVFGDWGITLDNRSEQTPISGSRSVFVWPEGPKTDAPAILNDAPDGEDAGPLVIHFSQPVRQLSLHLAASTAVTATERLFNSDGVLLREEATSLLPGYTLLNPVLLQDLEGRAISRVEVEYSDAHEPEALFLIHASFTNPPAFRRCVAQAAHGRLAEGERTLQTQLSMTSSAIPNRYSWPLHAVAMLSLEFRDPSGAPLPVILDGQQGAHFDSVLEDVQSKIVRTTGSVSELDRGYACVASNYPVELAAVYRILDSDGKPVSETGIQGAIPGYRFFGIFQKNLAEETNTALALANVSDQEAKVSITFYLPLFKKHTVEVVLAPGEQRASFIDELVSELSGKSAEGTVEIVSDQTLVGTIVRTIRGVVSASLPLGRSPTPDLK